MGQRGEGREAERVSWRECIARGLEGHLGEAEKGLGTWVTQVAFTVSWTVGTVFELQ